MKNNHTPKPAHLNPHDALFKKLLSSQTRCKAFVQHYFDHPILKEITHIELLNKSFVDKRLQNNHSDMIFKLTLDKSKEAFIFLLCEHQSSTPDQFFIFRLIQYVEKFIKEYTKMNPGKKWPLIMTSCLYHGKTSPFPHPNHFYDYFEDPKTAQELAPFEKFNLIDLTTLSDAQIQQNKHTATLFQLLKHSRDKDFFEHYIEVILAFGKNTKTLDIEDIEAIFMYNVYCEKNNHTLEEVSKKFEPYLNKDTIMTLAHTLINQGIQEGEVLGLQKGKIEGKIETAKKMLSKKYTVQDIVELTGLSKEQIEELKK